MGSIFDSFNARNLSPEQVAKTFVPPECFETLVNRSHSFVVGPRGSGKTTLLKMLHPSALMAWRDDVGLKFRDRVDYTGVFVPSDIIWRKQLDRFNQLNLPVELAKAFSSGAFTMHVLRALITSIRSRLAKPNLHGAAFRAVSLRREDEVEFVRDLSRVWGVAPSVPSLRSLQHALTDTLLGLSSVINREVILGQEGREARLQGLSFLVLELVPAVVAAIERFNDYARESDARWAFLFDELELAPVEIFKEVASFVRSTDERIIFKLSLNPVSEAVELLKGALAAMPAQDYDLIRLWYPYKEDSLEFSGRLLEAMLREKGMDPIDPITLLGRSVTDFGRGDWQERGTSYYRSSPAQRVLEGLQKSDPTFRKFLVSKNIDLSNMEALDPNERAATLRKLAPIAAVRLTYRTPQGANGKLSRQEKRSRKNPRLYAGARSLFAVFEGNPRIFIGVMNRLLSDYCRDLAAGRPKRSPLIDRRKQTAEIHRVSNLFKAMLRVIRVDDGGGGEFELGLLSILDKVGGYLRDSVVVKDFSLDPIGTFVVDRGVSSRLEESLRAALNAGAIVYIPGDDDAPVLESLQGCRFRLSYLLAPSYKIPLRLGRSVLLSEILEGRRRRPKDGVARHSMDQGELPYEDQ